MQIFFPFLSSKHDQGFIRFPRYLPFSRLDVFLRRFRRLSLGSAAICDDWALISLDYEGTEGSELKHRRKILNLLALRKQKDFFSFDLSFISQHCLLCFYFIFCSTCEMFVFLPPFFTSIIFPMALVSVVTRKTFWKLLKNIVFNVACSGNDSTVSCVKTDRIEFLFISWFL